MDDETLHEANLKIGQGAMEMQDALAKPGVADAVQDLVDAAYELQDRLRAAGVDRRTSVGLIASLTIGPVADDG
jgi:hypothetical protein